MKNSSYPSTKRLQGDEIRLIKIRSGEWSDQIRCELVHNRLSDVRPYHALSYVWGSNKTTRPILLNEEVYHATVNLESALRHLRHQLKDISLWIDALCINQTDDNERTHQVGIMGSIYRSCQSVLVYLGDGVGRRERVRNKRIERSVPHPPITFLTDLTNSPVKCTETLPENGMTLNESMSDTLKVFSLIRMLSIPGHLNELEYFRSDEHPDASKSTYELFEAFRQLTHAPFTPWWTRIWVVQEVIFPPQVTLFCGGISASWKMFAQAASNYSHHSQQCCASTIRSFPRDNLNVLQGFCRLVLDLEHMRQPSPGRYNSIDEPSRSPSGVERESRSLLPLLRRFRDRKASDPRDKVYALLSLVEVKKNQVNMRPDYTLSEIEVFKRAALASIYNSQSLSVLHIDLARKYRHDLPSWVPDWEAPGEFSDTALLDPINLYDTCASHLVGETTISSSRDVLFVEAKTVDTMARVAPVMFSEEWESVRTTLETWHSEIVASNCFSPANGEWGADGHSTEWCRLLCADIITYPGGPARRVHPGDEIMFKNWVALSQLSPASHAYKTTASRSAEADALRSDLADTEHPWLLLVHFGESILGGDTQHISRIFEKLIPEKDLRAQIVQEAFGKHKDNPRITFRSHHYRDALDAFKRMSLYKEAGELMWYHAGDSSPWRPSSRPHGSSAPVSGEHMRTSRRLLGRHAIFMILPWTSILESARPYVWERLRTEIRTGKISVSQQVAIMDHSVMVATKSRCLFITRGGCIGLGPATVTEGDNLCLLKGWRTPFVLRNKRELVVISVSQKDNRLKFFLKPLSQEDVRILDHHLRGGAEAPVAQIQGYELIGDCYARGLMDSKTLDIRLDSIWQSLSGWQTSGLV